MESQKPKIAMYVKRPFGEKLNASFDFLKENWKLLLKFTTYLLLPLCLIQALSLNGLMSGALSISAIASSTNGCVFFFAHCFRLLLWIIYVPLSDWNNPPDIVGLWADPDI